MSTSTQSAGLVQISPVLHALGHVPLRVCVCARLRIVSASASVCLSLCPFVSVCLYVRVRVCECLRERLCLCVCEAVSFYGEEVKSRGPGPAQDPSAGAHTEVLGSPSGPSDPTS